MSATVEKPAVSTDRRIVYRSSGMPTQDGAGVKLTRLVGTPKLPDLDPILMLDTFRSDNPNDYLAGFPEHPHRGFETVSYMIKGSIAHLDNHGGKGIVTDGGVQWMTAGRGVAHSEMPAQTNGQLFGFQLWLNLPAREKMRDPWYADIPASDIPQIDLGGGNIAKLMQAKPASRLMLVGGYYDLTVPLAGPRYEITHSAIPLDRVTMAALPGLSEVPEDARRTPFSPIGFRLGGGDPDSLVRGSDGRVRVQDEGSQLAALALTRTLPVAEGERWLDLCAGPGGKTAVLAAEALAHGATLEANEISPARAGLVRQAIAGVPLDVPVSEEDGRLRAQNAPDTYDRILVDAPCTGLGALRRRPEARWRKAPSDVPALTGLQRELLGAAVSALKPGGVVAYVTCSPHLAETSGVVADVRREWGAALEEVSAREVITGLSDADPGLAPQADGSGRAQLWPHRHNTDAMSVSLLRRV